MSAAYRRLFASTVVVIFGIMGQSVARGWLAYDLTGSNAGLGGVMLAFGFAMLLATPWGGVAADRLSKRSVLLVSVVVLLVSSLALGVAVELDVVTYWMLVVASSIQAAAFAFYLPARIALIVEFVNDSDVVSGVVLAQVSQEAMRVGGPALAGLLIGVAWVGVGGVFLLSAALSAVSGVLLWTLPRPPRPHPDGGRGSPLGELVDAMRYIHSRPELSLVALTTVAVVMIGFPYLTFLPTVAQDRFDVGAAGYGLMSGAAGLGAVTAGLLSGRFSRRSMPWVTMGAGGVMFAGALIALGVAPIFPLALMSLLFVGAGGLIFQTSSQSLMLSLSDFEYHGRMQSMVVLGFSGFGLAALPLGLLADAASLPATLVAMGAVVAALSGGFLAAGRRRMPRALSTDLG